MLVSSGTNLTFLSQITEVIKEAYGKHSIQLKTNQ